MVRINEYAYQSTNSCRIDDVVKNQTVNDIFAIHKNDEGYWFGTSFGLTRLYQGEYRVYNETDGFSQQYDSRHIGRKGQ